jgi:hypothetical protein
LQQIGKSKGTMPTLRFQFCVLLCWHFSLFLRQSVSIQKSIFQGLNHVAGNPKHDLTPEAVDRKVKKLALSFDIKS